MKLKVGLAQISPLLGNLKSNLALHLKVVSDAAKQEVELLVFPELSLTGYGLRDLAFSAAIEASAQDTTIAALLEASHLLDMVMGFVEKDKRHRFFIKSATPNRELTAEDKVSSAQRVEQISKTYASLFTDFVIHVNRSGSENGVNYFGGSIIFGPEGNQIVQDTYYKEGLFTAELDLTQLRRARIHLPLLRDERSELTARELRRILQSR